MSDEPVVTEFKRLLGEVRDLARAEGVEAERKLAAAVKEYRLIACLHPVCKKRIRCSEPKPEPEPPPPEPMTIAKVLANIRGGSSLWRHGPDCEADLILLVKEQARLDALILAEMRTKATKQGDYSDAEVLRHARDGLLVAAGLE